MSAKDLDRKLNQILIDYSDEIRNKYKEGGSEPVSESDINELARQTFYVLDEFRKQIVNYLNQQ